MHVEFSVVGPVGESVVPSHSFDKIRLIPHDIGFFQIISQLSVGVDALLKIHIIELGV